MVDGKSYLCRHAKPLGWDLGINMSGGHSETYGSGGGGGIVVGGSGWVVLVGVVVVVVPPSPVLW